MKLVAIDPGAAGLSLSESTLESHGIAVVDPTPIVEYVRDRHDFPEGTFEQMVFLQSSRTVVRAASRPLGLPSAPAIDRAGIEFLRVDMATPRLTTAASMTWAGDARRNVVDLGREQCLDYLRRNPNTLDSRQRQQCSGRGFILVRHRGWGLGVGFLESTRPDDDNFGRLQSMYPSAFAADVELASPFANPDRTDEP